MGEMIIINPVKAKAVEKVIMKKPPKVILKSKGWPLGIIIWILTPLLEPQLLLLLLSHFSRVQLCATPEMAAHQAPLSLGFSRQEHWSGLPFPSPVHESEKWKWLLSHVWLLATPWTAAHQAPLSMGFSRQEYWSGVPLPSPSTYLDNEPIGNLALIRGLTVQVYQKALIRGGGIG